MALAQHCLDHHLVHRRRPNVARLVRTWLDPKFALLAEDRYSEWIETIELAAPPTPPAASVYIPITPDEASRLRMLAASRRATMTLLAYTLIKPQLDELIRAKAA